MAKFTENNFIANMSAIALEECAKENAGVVATVGNGFEMPVPCTVPVHGWVTRVINTNVTGNKGTIVLVPVTPRNRQLFYTGQVELAKRSGMDYLQAVAWANSKVAHKHELLSAVTDVIDVSALVEDIIAYERSGSRHRWVADNNHLPANVLELSHQQLISLASILRILRDAY